MSDLRVIEQPPRSLGDAPDKEIAAAVEQLASGFEKLSLAMKSRSWRREGRAGLGPLQRQILSLLRSKQGQTAQVSVIANELVVRMPTASEAVATLERKRLVRRRRTARDGRVVTVELTARGLKACSATAEKSDHLVSAISMLEQAEQSMLLKTLVKVIRTLQERGEISVARMCVSCRFFRPHRYEDADQPHHCEYVNAPFGDPALRLDCREFEPAAREQARDAWLVFTGGRSAIG